MSRSANRRLAAAVLAATLLAAGNAQAADPGLGHTHELIAHTYDLHATTTDPGRTARVTTHGQDIDVVLDSNVLFAKDSDRLQPKARTVLVDLAAQIRSHGPGQLEITGYTDDLGSAEHGLELSRRRAAAVATQLGKLPGVRVTTMGKGEQDPAVPNTSESHRAQNRRVEIHYRQA